MTIKQALANVCYAKNIKHRKATLAKLSELAEIVEPDEGTCEHCYYEYFDPKAYPCSLCIHGIERTEKFEPKKETSDCAWK